MFLQMHVDHVLVNRQEKIQKNKKEIQSFIHLIEILQKEQMEIQILMLLLALQSLSQQLQYQEI